jgi:cell division protein FtsW (lipid II flippase)
MGSSYKVRRMLLSLVGAFALGVAMLFVLSALTRSPDIGLLMLIAGLAVVTFLARALKQRVSLGCGIAGYVMVIVAVILPECVPNTTRPNVARAVSEMRNLAVSIEAYRSDHHVYPPACDISGKVVPAAENGVSVGYVPYLLTTPTGYVREIPTDPFHKVKGGVPYRYTYRYATNGSSCWILASLGPDEKETMRIIDYCDPNKANGDLKKFLSQYGGDAIQYDTTNGTTSDGDVMRFGP